jgi:hypothetical protein
MIRDILSAEGAGSGSFAESEVDSGAGPEVLTGAV